VPILLARGNRVIKTNSARAACAFLWALSLFLTAANPPDERFSSGGSYEDRASGIPEFILFFLFVLLLSYVLLLIDLLLCAGRKILARYH
jgi:hypothetical protein